MMLVSDAFHVMLSVFMFAIECCDVNHTRVVNVHVSPHSSDSIEVEIVWSPSPLWELISPNFFVDCAGQGILSSHAYHIFILDAVLAFIWNILLYIP